MKLKNKKIFFGVSLTLFCLLCFINLFALGSLYEAIFLRFNGSIFEPIFIWSVALLACSVVLLFFSKKVFEVWLRNIFLWYLPLGLLVTFLADPSISFALPNRAGFATILGEILLAMTIVFVLIQRFYFKR